MKRIGKVYLLLLIFGMLLINLDFLIKHFMQISDSLNGFIKGVGIGLLIVALKAGKKQRKTEQSKG